jgi:hypothetical protein
MPLFCFSTAQKQFVSSLVFLSFFAGILNVPVLANTPAESQTLVSSRFGDNWPAHPLVDTTVPPKSVLPQKPQISQAMLDAKLSPYEDFMKAIEKSLAIIIPSGSSRVARLNAIQKIVFDEQLYRDDAGQLIARLQKVFPKEAASTLKPWNYQSIQTAHNAQQGPQIVSSAPLPSVPDGVKVRQSQLTRRESARLQKAQQKALNKQNDDFFGNDPFFKDDNSTVSSSSGSKAKAALGGVAGLAMLAGGMAGSYYMNKNVKAPSYGSTTPVYGYPNYPVVNNPYNPYSNTTPYGAGQAYYPQPQYLGNYGYANPVVINQQKGIGGILNQVLGNNNYPQGYYPYNQAIQGYNPYGTQTYTSNGVTYYNTAP